MIVSRDLTKSASRDALRNEPAFERVQERDAAYIKGIRLSGFLAWSAWLLVHLWYLIGFQNRILVLIRWSFSFATHGRGARLIADHEPTSRRKHHP